jgi:hypothetical protein
MQSIITIKEHGTFTEEHLNFVKTQISKEAFPQFYSNNEYKSLVFEDFLLVDQALILSEGYGTSQSFRAAVLNPKYEELKTDILDSGWKLYCKPIFVKRLSGGKFSLIDGRTKHKILSEKKYKNRICAVVKVNEAEEEKLAYRLNAGEDSPTAGLILEEDLLQGAFRAIDQGHLEVDLDDIREWISTCLGKGKFSTTKRSELADRIYQRADAYKNNKLLPVIYANQKEAQSWLESNNYIETSNVLYLPYPSSAPLKAISAAAKLSKQNPTKEIRIVVYVSRLTGQDLQKSYINSILSFKDKFHTHLDEISNSFFDRKPYVLEKINLYGCAPSNIEDICEDMDKVIVFGKTDKKINSSYLGNRKMSSVFGVTYSEDSDEENENE